MLISSDRPGVNLPSETHKFTTQITAGFGLGVQYNVPEQGLSGPVVSHHTPHLNMAHT